MDTCVPMEVIILFPFLLVICAFSVQDADIFSKAPLLMDVTSFHHSGLEYIVAEKMWVFCPTHLSFPVQTNTAILCVWKVWGSLPVF